MGRALSRIALEPRATPRPRQERHGSIGEPVRPQSGFAKGQTPDDPRVVSGAMEIVERDLAKDIRRPGNQSKRVVTRVFHEAASDPPVLDFPTPHATVARREQKSRVFDGAGGEHEESSRRRETRLCALLFDNGADDPPRAVGDQRAARSVVDEANVLRRTNLVRMRRP